MQYIPTVYVKEETRWEYKLIECASAEPMQPEALDELGYDGWELAGVLPSGDLIIYYFKRLT